MMLAGCAQAPASISPDWPQRAHEQARASLTELERPSILRAGETESIDVEIGDASAIVTYDPQWLDDQLLDHGWDVAVAWIAHELGHVVDVERGLTTGGPLSELSADTWAGCATVRLGGDVRAVALAMLDIQPVATLTHPSGPDRAAAILRGAEGCSDE